jgi:hypothetical protein
LIERWNGRKWTATAASDAGELDGVSHTSTGHALAVGATINAGGDQSLTLAEQWDGSIWRTVASTDATLASDSHISGLAAASPRDVWAVGTYDIVSSSNPSGSTVHGLIEQFDGTRWSIVPNSDNGAIFAGVAAISTRDVWAAGNYYPSDAGAGLIEHWDGSSWHVVPSPNRTGGDNQLNAISAVTPKDIWAAGSFTDFNGDHPSAPLLEHWNGKRWSLEAPAAGLNGSFTSLAAVSAHDVWAAGIGVSHWNGRRWSRIKTAPGVSDRFNGIAATSKRDVWAAGYSYTADGKHTETMAQHWNGKQWSDVSGPSLPGTDSLLSAVDATSAKDVWAVGNSGDVNESHGLIEHWNGVEWLVVPNPKLTESHSLSAVAVRGKKNLWAAGGRISNTDGQEQTLIEHSNGC